MLKPESPRQTKMVGYPRSSVLDNGYKAVKKTNVVAAHMELYNLVRFYWGDPSNYK